MPAAAAAAPVAGPAAVIFARWRPCSSRLAHCLFHLCRQVSVLLLRPIQRVPLVAGNASEDIAKRADEAVAQQRLAERLRPVVGRIVERSVDLNDDRHAARDVRDVHEHVDAKEAARNHALGRRRVAHRAERIEHGALRPAALHARYY
eukprot:353830-Chlamydomonas_euryale.AAC.16